MTTTPRAPEPSQSDLDAYNDDHEEDDFDTDDWDMSMDSDFENYLNKMMSHAIDRPRPQFFRLYISLTRKVFTSGSGFSIMCV